MANTLSSYSRYDVNTFIMAKQSEGALTLLRFAGLGINALPILALLARDLPHCLGAVLASDHRRELLRCLAEQYFCYRERRCRDGVYIVAAL